MIEEEKTYQKLAGYPMYKNFMPKNWIGHIDKDARWIKWWENICGDFPNIGEFYRRLQSTSLY